MKHDPKITEAVIQAIMMPYILEKLRHELVIPNPQKLLPYEADLVSFTRNGLLHEWEDSATPPATSVPAQEYTHRPRLPQQTKRYRGA